MDLENVQLQTVCRTCLTKNINMKNIFNITHIINSCSSIDLEQDDGLPSTICSECNALARKAYGFRLLCEHSDKVLREILRKSNSVTIKTERYDVNSKEVHIDADCSTYDGTKLFQTDDSSLEINNINELDTNNIFRVNEDEILELKTEILDLDDCKEFQTFNNESLITNHPPDNTTHMKDNTTDSKVTTNNVNNKESCTSDKEKSKVTSNNSKVEIIQRSKYPCQYCGQNFLLKRNLQWHEENHGEGLKCDICGKCFSNKEKYRKHVGVHKRKGVYICPTCGKHFTYPENLKVHQRIHTGIKPFSCRFCDKSFTAWSDRRSHEFTHTQEKSYLCSICGIKFARSASLLSHTRRIHFNPSEERQHGCSVCDKKFKVRRDLNKHMFCHSEKRNFVCKVCNKGFKHRSNLGLHVKIHMGIKPHVCPVCQRAFLQKHVLTSHLRTHAPK